MTLPVIIENDSTLQKIRQALKEFKEDIMLNARFKLKKWGVKKNGRDNIKDRDQT